jgi:hypothetical protein
MLMIFSLTWYVVAVLWFYGYIWNEWTVF